MARLDLPEGTPWAYAVFAPCFTCGKDWLAAARISRELAERGIAVFSVDFTGLGESGGDFADSTFSSDVDDLVRAADHLREHFAAPSILIGHSLGGAAVLASAHRIPEVTVGVENAQRILDAARHPKSFIAIDGADHLLTDRADARYVAIMLAAWADRYARGPVGAGPT